MESKNLIIGLGILAGAAWYASKRTASAAPGGSGAGTGTVPDYLSTVDPAMASVLQSQGQQAGLTPDAINNLIATVDNAPGISAPSAITIVSAAVGVEAAHHAWAARQTFCEQAGLDPNVDPENVRLRAAFELAQAKLTVTEATQRGQTLPQRYYDILTEAQRIMDLAISGNAAISPFSGKIVSRADYEAELQAAQANASPATWVPERFYVQLPGDGTSKGPYINQTQGMSTDDYVRQYFPAGTTWWLESLPSGSTSGGTFLSRLLGGLWR